MTIQVRLFAGLKEQLGRDVLDVALAPGATASELKAAVAERYPELAPLLSGTRVAVDQAFVASDTRLAPGAEVALIPPVSGG